MIDHLPCFSFSQARLSSLHHDPYDMILYLVWLSVLFDLDPAGFPFVVVCITYINARYPPSVRRPPTVGIRALRSVSLSPERIHILSSWVSETYL
jgi:hypothetical protein